MGKTLTAVMVTVLLAGCEQERKYEAFSFRSPNAIIVVNQDTGAVKRCRYVSDIRPAGVRKYDPVLDEDDQLPEGWTLEGDKVSKKAPNAGFECVEQEGF